MTRKIRIIQPKARETADSFMYETAGGVGGRLSAGDNPDIKRRAEQTGSGMVDKMSEEHEIIAESSGFATQENKYNSSRPG